MNRVVEAKKRAERLAHEVSAQIRRRLFGAAGLLHKLVYRLHNDLWDKSWRQPALPSGVAADSVTQESAETADAFCRELRSSCRGRHPFEREQVALIHGDRWSCANDLSRCTDLLARHGKRIADRDVLVGWPHWCNLADDPVRVSEGNVEHVQDAEPVPLQDTVIDDLRQPVRTREVGHWSFCETGKKLQEFVVDPSPNAHAGVGRDEVLFHWADPCCPCGAIDRGLKRVRFAPRRSLSIFCAQCRGDRGADRRPTVTCSRRGPRREQSWPEFLGVTPSEELGDRVQPRDTPSSILLWLLTLVPTHGGIEAQGTDIGDGLAQGCVWLGEIASASTRSSL
ncbi:hypothetical protein EDF26_10270 [Curtobacterium sp. PhB134]|nr:hypothetical protein EDF26_10270 [Curtobacterium sp. PhB134]